MGCYISIMGRRTVDDFWCVVVLAGVFVVGGGGEQITFCFLFNFNDQYVLHVCDKLLLFFSQTLRHDEKKQNTTGIMTVSSS